MLCFRERCCSILFPYLLKTIKCGMAPIPIVGPSTTLTLSCCTLSIKLRFINTVSLGLISFPNFLGLFNSLPKLLLGFSEMFPLTPR
jgi:hypothetical protein